MIFGDPAAILEGIIAYTNGWIFLKSFSVVIASPLLLIT
jgi:hypothetical protein